jgi:CDP-diacylglycerol--serine O-phosphatidyltransferase
MKKQIPNLFTLLNLFFGCCAIVVVMYQGVTVVSDEGGEHWLMLPETVWMASLFIGLAAVVDFLDGFLARALKQSSEMGKQLDSLSDVVSFGVAPSLIIFHFLQLSIARQENGLNASWLWMAPAFLIAMAAAWRLARFNISPEDQEGFTGVPAPAAGLLIASFPLIYWYASSPILLEVLQTTWFWYALIVLVGWLMISRLPLLAFKFKKGDARLRLPLLVLFITALLGGLLLKWLAVPLVFILYILLSLFYKKRKQ